MDDQRSDSDLLNQLVGEGKKFKSAEELAKAKLESDRYIEFLTKQADELREEVEKRMKIEELFDKQTGTVKKTEVADPPVADKPLEDKPASAQTSTETDSELIERVKAALRADAAVETSQKNLEAAAKRLADEYGGSEKAKEVWARKAAELGVSSDFLSDVAAKSPNALYNLFGLAAKPKPGNGTPATVNTEALGKASEDSAPQMGTKAYFDHLRKTNPSKYLSREVQLAKYKAYAADPESFKNG
jgi:hypothetical protein